jgi:hypothetical protein
MQTNAVPVKTERGRMALRRRDFDGSRAQRALLIMVDGRNSVDRLAPVMASLGLSWSDLQQMADAGLLAWHALSRPDATASMGTRPAARPPAALQDESETLPQPAFEVAEAVLIVLEQTQRLLGDADLPLREAASRLHDAAGLHGWLTMATAAVEAALGASAAGDFERVTRSRLEEDLLTSGPVSGDVDIRL